MLAARGSNSVSTGPAASTGSASRRVPHL